MGRQVNENVVALALWALGCVAAFGGIVAAYAVYYAIVG